jgi:hypothetical protein
LTGVVNISCVNVGGDAVTAMRMSVSRRFRRNPQCDHAMDKTLRTEHRRRLAKRNPTNRRRPMSHHRIRQALIVCASMLGATAVSLQVPGAEPAFPAGEYAAGKIALTFDANGHMRLNGDGAGLLVDGEFTAHGDQIRLTDKSGPMACPAAQTGIYRWSYADQALTFTKIEDACDGRSGDLVAHPWKRKK